MGQQETAETTQGKTLGKLPQRNRKPKALQTKTPKPTNQKPKQETSGKVTLKLIIFNLNPNAPFL